MQTLRYNWPQSQLDLALSTALSRSSHSAELQSPDQAKKYRFALYNRRRQLGAEYKQLSIIIEEDERTVTVYRPVQLIIKQKVSEEELFNG